jgi:hypothetical protein
MSDSFLNSMTFTTPGDFLDRDCDCEECDNIPIDIRNAIQKRKRLRLQTGPIKRTQQRTLINRHNHNNKASIITLWSISMPKNAEPLVEFGSSHRIVWVKRIGRRSNNNDSSNNNNNNNCTATNNGSSILQSIGKGIIGSSDEEKSRKYLNDFTEGSVFLVPSNGGKAIGWIHTTTTADNDSNDNSNNNNNNNASDNVTDNSNDFLRNNYDEEREEKKNDQEIEEKNNNSTNGDDNVLTTNPTSTEDNNDGYAVLYVAKIPLDVLDQKQEKDNEDGNNDDDDNWKWVKPLIKGCHDGLKSIAVSDNGNDKTNIIVPPLYYKFSDDATQILQKAMLEAERMSPKI